MRNRQAIIPFIPVIILLLKMDKWNLMAIWDKTKTGWKLFSGLYSFVENFGSNGNDFFKAEYGNQWVCTPSGTWIRIDQMSFNHTASP